MIPLLIFAASTALCFALAANLDRIVRRNARRREDERRSIARLMPVGGSSTPRGVLRRAA